MAVSTSEMCNNGTETEESGSFELTSKVLSRRKRYLIFPDGSSFQLVFCTQNMGYLPVQNVIWFGNTAALAWELPTDPNVFHGLKKYEKGYILQRRQDNSKHIYYMDEFGKVIAKVPYKRKPIVNPAFAKRSVDNTRHNIMKISIPEMHGMQKARRYLDNIEESNIDFHREGRKDLYEKLETFINALGWNGRECVLRLLCESGKRHTEQGTFLQEIMRATFTLPRGSEFASATHRQYDVAHGSYGDCANEYPQCEDLHGFQLYDSL
ncbi:uncharacterized protein ACR2FA_000284 [Aphomia sociella]